MELLESKITDNCPTSPLISPSTGYKGLNSQKWINLDMSINVKRITCNSGSSGLQCVYIKLPHATMSVTSVYSTTCIFTPTWGSISSCPQKRLQGEVQETRGRVSVLQQDLDNSEKVQQDFVRLSQSLQVGGRGGGGVYLYIFGPVAQNRV